MDKRTTVIVERLAEAIVIKDDAYNVPRDRYDTSDQVYNDVSITSA